MSQEHLGYNFNEEKPSANLQNPSADLFSKFTLIANVFQQIESETADIAELIFDYLVNVDDEHIMTGTIPPHGNNRVNAYIKILNRLFLFSRRGSKKGLSGDEKRYGVIIISRRTIEDLDKKTFAICMCHDGGTSLDILCDIVNVENKERTPTSSPVKITIRKMSGKGNEMIL